MYIIFYDKTDSKSKLVNKLNQYLHIVGKDCFAVVAALEFPHLILCPNPYKDEELFKYSSTKS